ncbi:restriction endonuclease [Amycolatopsis antarctica]|nr:restriction endonuclease [Amycolatopsis antarctica]
MLTDLSPGDQLLRRELHQRFGGRQQGGIGPSSKAKVVMFFTAPAVGQQHGYYDGWDSDRLFHYVGEGQRGDQQLTQGNKSILNHRRDGRSLEGFRSEGTTVTYLGEFELVGYYFTDAHETGDPDSLRQVVVFKMRPLNKVPVDLPQLPVSPAAEPRAERVPVEEQHTERAHVSPDREPYEFERREATLVHRYQQHLVRHGHDVSRLRLIPPGETSPLYSDLWDETTRELVEAKGTVTRQQIRLAVGQLLDYQRFANAESLALLVPTRPRDDLLAYLDAVGIKVVYPDGHDWVRLTHAKAAGA